MGKKSSKKKNKRSNQENDKKYIIDVSHRKNISMKSDNDSFYSDEELIELIEELENQIRRLELIEQKYYSNNACIDKIIQRSSWDLIRGKLDDFIAKRNSSIHLKKNVNKI